MVTLFSVSHGHWTDSNHEVFTASIKMTTDNDKTSFKIDFISFHFWVFCIPIIPHLVYSWCWHIDIWQPPAKIKQMLGLAGYKSYAYIFWLQTSYMPMTMTLSNVRIMAVEYLCLRFCSEQLVFRKLGSEVNNFLGPSSSSTRADSQK